MQNRRKFLKIGSVGAVIGSALIATPQSLLANISTTKKTGIKYKNDFQRIYEYVSSLPVFSDHDHHHPDSFFTQKMTLDRALMNSYVNWTGFTSDGTPNSRKRLLDNVKFNSYFHWFEKGLQFVHDFDEPITLENWDTISAILEKAYSGDKNYHWKALKKNGFERLLLDTYWDPGNNNGHPEIFTAVFRIDKFMYGFHSESEAPNNIIPWKHYGFDGSTLDDFVGLMRETIRSRHKAGEIVALKCAEAYNRTVDFMPDDKNEAVKAFGLHPNKITDEQRILFGNYIFNRGCEIAAELDIPFQVHTGLAQLRYSEPMKLLPIIKLHRKTNFVLFHSGYPWTDQTLGLAHNHSNVFPSLTWTVTIDTSKAIQVLHSYIDVARSINTITWGSDNWLVEEAVGTLLAWRFVVAKVLYERLSDGRLNVEDTELLARKLMYENGRNVYMK